MQEKEQRYIHGRVYEGMEEVTPVFYRLSFRRTTADRGGSGGDRRKGGSMMNLQNPAAILQMMNLWSRFQKNHPKFPKFLSAVVKNGIKEGSIIEIKVTTAEGESYDSNLKVNAEDMDMIEQIKNLTLNR